MDNKSDAFEVMKKQNEVGKSGFENIAKKFRNIQTVANDDTRANELKIVTDRREKICKRYLAED